MPNGEGGTHPVSPHQPHQPQRHAQTHLTSYVGATSVRFTIKIKAKGIKAPKGKITVKVADETKSTKLKAKKKGKTTITMTRVPDGSSRIKITYKGSAQTTKITKTGTLNFG
jgi:hypothetical protein